MSGSASAAGAAKPEPASFGSADDEPLGPLEEYRRRVTALYEEQLGGIDAVKLAKKLGGIDALLAKHGVGGQATLHALYLRICEKYKVDPQPRYDELRPVAEHGARPLSAEDIIAKFRANAELTFAPERVDQVLDAIMDLDGKTTPTELAALLSPV